MNLLALNFDKKLLDALDTWRKNPGGLLPQLLKDAGASENWQLLATPIAGLTRHDTTEVAVKLLDPTVEGKATQFGWDWGAKAAATAELSIDLLSDEQLHDMNMKPGDKHQIVGYSASFQLSASAGGSQKIGAWGSASVDGSVSGGARLTWYVEAPQTQLLLEAALDARRFAVLPNDLEGLMRLAGDGIFWGTSMALNGRLQAGLSAKLQAGTTGWTYGFSGDKVDIGLTVHAGISAKIAVTGGMTLRVLPERAPSGGPWGLRVNLETVRASNKSFAASIGAALDLSALAKSAENAIRAGLPALDPASSARLNALTLPGTAIKDKLATLIDAKIGDAGLKQLAQVLFGQADASDVKQVLLDRLADPLSDLLDRSLDVLAQGTGIAEGEVDDVLTRLLGDDPATADLKAKLKAPITQASTMAATALKAAIKQLVDDIKAKAGGPLDEVLTPLGALGEKVAQALRGLDQSSFATAVRDTIAEYNKQRNRLLQALGDASKAKLGIELAMSVETSRNGKLAFSGWFGPGVDQQASQRLYQALCTGRLMLLGDLVDAALEANTVRDVSGWLTESLKRTSKASVTINLFGLSLSNSTTRLIDLAFKTDLWGNIVAATALASAEAAIANPWAQRLTQLGVAASVVDDPATARKAVEIALQGAYTAQGKRTNRRWVQSVVDGYASDMGRSSRVDVGEALGAPDDAADSAKSFWRGVTLAMPIRIDAQGWARFQARSDQEIGLAFLTHGLACLDRVYADMRGFAHTRPSEALLERASDVVDAPAGTAPAVLMLTYLGRYQGLMLKAAGQDYLNSIGFSNLVAGGTGFLSATQATGEHVQAGVFHRFAALMRSGIALKAAAGELSAALLPAQPQDPAVLRSRAEGPLQRIGEALSHAAVAGETLTALGLLGAQDEGVPWALSTFALALAQLAGEEPPLVFGNRTVDGEAASAVPLLSFV